MEKSFIQLVHVQDSNIKLFDQRLYISNSAIYHQTAITSPVEIVVIQKLSEKVKLIIHDLFLIQNTNNYFKVESFSLDKKFINYIDLTTKRKGSFSTEHIGYYKILGCSNSSICHKHEKVMQMNHQDIHDYIDLHNKFIDINTDISLSVKTKYETFNDLHLK